MSRYPVDRYNEQRLTQEVLYLHSLWHQGPPRPHHPKTLNPTPTPLSLQPSSSTQFKKRGKKNSKGIKKGLNPPTDSVIEWPCPAPAEPPPPTDSGWPTLTTKSTSQPHPPTPQELAYFASNQAHQHALKAVSEHLNYSNDDTENDDDDDDDEDDDGKDFNFFVKLFAEDGALREYYDKNRESGEFSCLVCCGAGKKGWKKRFKDCVALVQHSVAIANTNTWQAHRAYGRVICQILGWDINRLPSIVLSAPDTQSSDKPVKDQGNEDDGGKNGSSGLSNTTDAVNISNDIVSEQKESFSNENQQENGGGSGPLEGNGDDGGKNGLSGLSDTTDAANISSDKVSQQKGSFSNENQQENGGASALLQHNSPSEASANRVLEEDISNSNIPEAATENVEGASNSLEALQEDMIVANDCEKDDVSKETARSISDKS